MDVNPAKPAVAKLSKQQSQGLEAMVRGKVAETVLAHKHLQVAQHVAEATRRMKMDLAAEVMGVKVELATMVGSVFALSITR
jgi:hypothetical protein